MASSTSPIWLTIAAAAGTLVVVGAVIAGPAIVACSSSPDGLLGCLRERVVEIGLLPQPEPEPMPVPEAPAPQPQITEPPPVVAATPELGLVRAEPDGRVIVAGSASPGAVVEVFANGTSIGTATAEGSGDWVLVPDAALEVGTIEISVSVQGEAARAPRTVTVVIPPRGEKAAPAATSDEGPAPAAAPEPEQASTPLPTSPTREEVPIGVAEAPSAISPADKPSDAPAVTLPSPPAGASLPVGEVGRGEGEPVTTPIDVAQAEPVTTPVDVATAKPVPLPVETAKAKPTPLPNPPADTSPLSGEVGRGDAELVAPPIETAKAEPAPSPAPSEVAKAEPEPTTPVSPAETPPLTVATAEPPVVAPVTPVTPAPATPATIDAIEIDGTATFFAGAGPEGATVKLYVDSRFVATAKVEGGRWLVEAARVINLPVQRVRVDMSKPGQGTMSASAEVNFVLASTVDAAATASTAAAPAATTSTALGLEPRLQVESQLEVDPAIPTIEAQPSVDPKMLRFASGKAIIRRGETLWSIAERVYGDGSQYRRIVEANDTLITRPGSIYPGQVFDLPKLPKPDESAPVN